MSCSCRHHVHPPAVDIPAGRDHLPRLLASYGQFRRAMLNDASSRAVLADWTAREQGDLGILLIEMWAVACEIIAFADETICHECFLRTARRSDSVHALVGVLGYRPRPAIAASVDLALTAGGRRAVTLPVGTAFRSGAVGEHPPQVFELTDPATIHPLNSRLDVQPRLLPTLGASGHGEAGTTAGTRSVSSLTVTLEGTGLAAGKTVRVITPGGSKIVRLAHVEAIAGPGAKRALLSFDSAIELDADTDWVSVTVEVSDAEATLWTVAVSGLGQPGVSASGTQLFLDRTYDRFGNGAPVLVTDGTYTRPFTLTAVATTTYRIAADTTYEFDDEEYTLPGASVPVTVLTLDTTLNDPDRMAPADQQVWDASDAQHLRVVGSWRTAGRAEAPEADDVDTTTIISDGIDLAAGSDSPFGDPVPTRFNLVDRDLRAVPIRGALDWSSGRLTIDDAESFWPPLRYPIQIHANIVTTTRGETVTGEVLGSGDAAATNQVFKLANGPLTYLGPDASTTGEVATTTLRVWVDGVEWSEVAHFVTSQSTDRVYVTRVNDTGDTEVVFGDGKNGARLPTGTDNITAAYRFGSGAIHPDPGTVTTMVESVDTITAITNPLAAYGGADAASSDEIRALAPRTALLLGRIVSRFDAEAVALDTPGVVTAVADWDWRADRLQAGILVRYIGHTSVVTALRSRLRSMTERDIAIDAVMAPPDNIDVGVAIIADPRRHREQVLAAVVDALTAEGGVLHPATLGVDGVLYRSRLAAAAVGVAGVQSVVGLYVNGSVFDDFAIAPAAGSYLAAVDHLAVWAEADPNGGASNGS